MAYDEAVERADAARETTRSVDLREPLGDLVELPLVLDRKLDLVPRVVDEREEKGVEALVERGGADAVHVDNVQVRAAGEPADRHRDLHLNGNPMGDPVTQQAVHVCHGPGECATQACECSLRHAVATPEGAVTQAHPLAPDHRGPRNPGVCRVPFPLSRVIHRSEQSDRLSLLCAPAQHHAGRKKDGAVASQLPVDRLRTHQTVHFAPGIAHEVKSTATCACALVPGGAVTNGFCPKTRSKVKKSRLGRFLISARAYFFLLFSFFKTKKVGMKK